MKRVTIAMFAIATIALLASLAPVPATAAEKTVKAKKPTNRIVVMYFHRTQRCPTCLRMGGYSEEAVMEGFAKQVKGGTVEFHYIDFQDKRNAALTKAYKVGGPALIVAKIVKNKVVAVADLKEMWTKNRDKKVFLKYVRDNVAAYLRPASKTARKIETGTSAQKAK